MAAAVVATAFCGCGSRDEEIVPLEPANTSAGIIAEDKTASVPEDAKAGGNLEESHAKVTVYVCGAINDPDVYVLPEGSRLIDAVNTAGGLNDDACIELLNLATPVADGQKIYIPTRDEVEEAIAQGDELYGATVNITANTPGANNDNDVSGQNSAPNLVNINTADSATLMTLPGIGQSKADKIIAYREANGGFSCIEDIMLVGGIKEGLFNKVKDKICVR